MRKLVEYWKWDKMFDNYMTITIHTRGGNFLEYIYDSILQAKIYTNINPKQVWYTIIIYVLGEKACSKYNDPIQPRGRWSRFFGYQVWVSFITNLYMVVFSWGKTSLKLMPQTSKTWVLIPKSRGGYEVDVRGIIYFYYFHHYLYNFM